MKILSLFVAAAALTAAASGADTTYWAFGDSITRGEGLGIVLDQVSGNDCLTNPYPVSKCGYHWRLRDALTTAGIANDVVNRGEAGEATFMGKTRISEPGEPLESSRCTDPDAGDVLLLMEGTNDISGGSVSTTTIKADLGAMMQEATDKCVHSAVASVIRRLLAGTANGSRDGDPGHPPTADLAVKVSALATEKNRAYVDVWTPLCPNQPCYTSHYWGRFNPADPGHVDPSGYGMMAPLFQASITAAPLPGSVALSAPSGNVTDSTPLFEWAENANSDWYFLEVDGGSGYGRWHPEEDVCGGGVCSFAPASALSDGNHTWRVRTRNLRGVGSWSADASFTVWTTPPGATTAVAPNNSDFFSSAPFHPTYRWNSATNAYEYELEVDDGGGIVVQETYLATSVCSGASCSAIPATGLGADTYTWRARATNPAGDGTWSSPLPFEVSCPPPSKNDLPAANVGGAVVENACVEIVAGEVGPYTIEGPGGEVVFHAGERITIHGGFTIEPDAEFTAIVDQ